jgi:hypothetical protein
VKVSDSGFNIEIQSKKKKHHSLTDVADYKWIVRLLRFRSMVTASQHDFLKQIKVTPKHTKKK